MDLIREEMTLLAEVDQPGSLIDSYVDKLEALLVRKAEGMIILRRSRSKHLVSLAPRDEGSSLVRRSDKPAQQAACLPAETPPRGGSQFQSPEQTATTAARAGNTMRIRCV